MKTDEQTYTLLMAENGNGVKKITFTKSERPDLYKIYEELVGFHNRVEKQFSEDFPMTQGPVLAPDDPKTCAVCSMIPAFCDCAAFTPKAARKYLSEKGRYEDETDAEAASAWAAWCEDRHNMLSVFLKRIAQRLRDDDELRARKDAAYLERNRLVALLARIYPSGLARTAIEGWSPEWHNCVYIDSPAGQLSWHYHDEHAHLFAGLPAYQKAWDGHTTEAKYDRIEAIVRSFDKRAF